MNQSKIYPVILSGGSGVRLWPLSRSSMPKQFLSLPDLNGGSLFGLTVERALGLDLPLGGLIVVCNESQKFLAASALSEIPNLTEKCGFVEMILEPLARNTAPAIALAAFAALDKAGGQEADPLLLVLPSDHEISPQSEFFAAVDKAAACAAAGYLTLFGIAPAKPAVGFGYLEQGRALEGSVGCTGFQVDRFIEKPNLESARAMLEQGGYFWNSGMFLFGARTCLNELEKYEPEIYAQCKIAWEKARRNEGVILPDAEAFAKAPKISIDYAVMERTGLAAMVPLKAEWSDLGSFEAFYQSASKDKAGNASFGDVLAMDSSNNYLLSQNRLLAVLGINDLVVVETADSVLVAPRGRCQEVAGLVANLKAAGRSEPQDPATVPKPWGCYRVLLEGNNFKVKQIEVLPGGRLSLQMHYKRSEHWVIVQGLGEVEVDDLKTTLKKNESIYIPSQAKHRLYNPGSALLVVIEVQVGAYLGEDDIVRFSDDYGRQI